MPSFHVYLIVVGHRMTATNTTLPSHDTTGFIALLQWHHNECDGVSNHQRHDGLLNRLFRRRSKKTLKLCVTGLCEGNSPETGEFSSQRICNAENASIWWRHHIITWWRYGMEMISTLLAHNEGNHQSLADSPQRLRCIPLTMGELWEAMPFFIVSQKTEEAAEIVAGDLRRH